MRSANTATSRARLQIQFSTTDPLEVVRDVLAERIDVGVAEITDANEDRRLDVEALPSHRIILACRPGHPLSRVARPSLVQVLGFPLVTTRLLGAASAAASGPDSTAQPAATATGFIPQVCVNSLALARLIARDSDALFPGTLGMLADDLAAGRLTLLDFAGPAIRTNYGLIYLRGRTLTPAARMFIDTLRAVESEAQITDAQPTFAARMVPQQRSPAGKPDCNACRLPT